MNAPQSVYRRSGFSMIELLATVAIMGLIGFMAIPSVTRMRADSERNLAISRAEALNIAQANFIQTQGRSRAETLWQSAASDPQRYLQLRPYLGFSETALATYMPSGYQITFPPSILTMTKCTIVGPEGIIRY